MLLMAMAMMMMLSFIILPGPAPQLPKASFLTGFLCVTALVFLALSSDQTDATCWRNIVKHCCTQHVAGVWPPCCTVLRSFGQPCSTCCNMLHPFSLDFRVVFGLFGL